MTFWRPITRGLRALARPGDADRDVADELEQFLADTAAAFEAAGLSPEEARRAARREIGNPVAVREAVRASGWEAVVGDFVADLRYAVRRLASRPGFTLVAAGTLALGIGATTAIFSVVDPLLFESIPYPHSERVFVVSQPNSFEGPIGRMGFATIADVGAIPSFASVAAVATESLTLTGNAEPESLSAERVSWPFFATLGVRPAIGRDFDREDDVRDGPAVAILGEGLWRRRFGGDPGILGKSIPLDGKPTIVVGVMPAGFEDVLKPDAQIWVPLRVSATSPDGCRFCRYLRAVARMRPGGRPGNARGELGRLVARLQREYPNTYFEPQFPMIPLRDFVVRDVRPVLFAVLGAVACVLLIAGVNVTNLLLGQAAQRRAEFAVRKALGAGRRRLVRQLLTESLLLAMVGGVLGVGIAFGGIPALTAIAPPGLPFVHDVAVNLRVLGFAFALTTAVGIVFGLAPALQSSRGGVFSAMNDAGRHTAGGRRTGRSALVATEVALAIVLLVGSGLLLRSLRRLLDVPPGFDPRNVLTMQIQTSGPRYATIEATRAYFDAVLAAVRATPGVESAGLTSQLPLSGDADQYGVHTEPVPGTGPNDREHPGFRYAVSDGYLETMRIPIRRGRGLRPSDRSGTLPVAVVDATTARHGWAGRGAIGRRVRIGPNDSGPWYTVVGIADDVKQASLDLESDNAIYIPESQWHFADDAMSLVVRSRVDPTALTAALRRAIRSVDRDVPVVRIATMTDLLERSTGSRRYALLLFQLFAAVAAILAGAGIYAVLAGSVAERTREIGVRAALGATRASIVRLVLRQGMTMTAVGVAAGLVAAAVFSPILATLLFATSRLDPAIYGGVATVLAAIAALACWVPAERAARVDPARTLRAE